MKFKTRFVIFLSSLFLAIGFLTWLYWAESQKILSQEVTAWTLDQKGDCGVVLTGSPGRVREGFDLLVQGRVRKLIISGVFPGAELRDIFPQLPYYGPVDAENVILEKRSTTTFGNAQQTQPLIEALGCKNIILVTSRLHMRRAYRLFKEVLPEGFEIKPRAVIVGSYQPEFFDLFLEVVKSYFYDIWAY